MWNIGYYQSGAGKVPVVEFIDSLYAKSRARVAREIRFMNWKEHKKRLMKDPGFRKEYELLETEYRLAADLIRLRLARGLTQEGLARLLNTKQESIARLESGSSLPSLSMIKKVANVLDAELEIKLQPRHQAAVGSVVGQPK